MRLRSIWGSITMATKTTDKTKEEVLKEDEDGTWPMSSFINFLEYCSVRLMCSGCWAEAIYSFDEWPCNKCLTQRPSRYSKKPPPKKVRQVKK